MNNRNFRIHSIEFYNNLCSNMSKKNAELLVKKLEVAKWLERDDEYFKH